jgi:hypothetical protein
MYSNCSTLMLMLALALVVLALARLLQLYKMSRYIRVVRSTACQSMKGLGCDSRIYGYSYCAGHEY